MVDFLNLLPHLRTLHVQDCGDHYEVEAEGGYYVVYPDGYKSFSPASAFEGGYRRIN